MANRIELVRGVLPPGVPGAARTIVLALGLGLIWLSRGLARRKRRAWWLAVAVVCASALAHLAKGLDVEEATVHLLLLAALFRPRRPGDGAAAPAGRVRARRLRRRRADRPLRSGRLLEPDRARARPRHARARRAGALALAAPARLGSGGSRRAGARLRARPRARLGQPRLLRAPPRQELLLRAERTVVPRLPRRPLDRARRRRPDRRRRRAPCADGGVPAG